MKIRILYLIRPLTENAMQYLMQVSCLFATILKHPKGEYVKPKTTKAE